MRSHLLWVIPVCLILGAITTICVAWACVMCIPTQVAPMSEQHASLSEDDKMWLRLVGMQPGTDLSGESSYTSDFTENRQGFGRSVRAYYSNSLFNGPSLDAYACREWSGWPLAAMLAGLIRHSTRSQPNGVLTLPIEAFTLYDPNAGNQALPLSGTAPSWMGPNIWAPRQLWDRGYLPIEPVWAGFIIDTLLFAAVWFCVFRFLPGAVRSVYRRRRGRCPRCNYDLRSDFARGCPECGWRRTIDERTGCAELGAER